MSEYRNYRVKTISIPEKDEDGELTGIRIILEVLETKTLKVVLTQVEGGAIYEDKLFYVCFQKQEATPKKLYVICIETEGEIEIIRYEHESNELRRGDQAEARTRGRRRKKGGVDIHPDNSKGSVDE